MKEWCIPIQSSKEDILGKSSFANSLGDAILIYTEIEFYTNVDSSRKKRLFWKYKKSRKIEKVLKNKYILESISEFI